MVTVRFGGHIRYVHGAWNVRFKEKHPWMVSGTTGSTFPSSRFGHRHHTDTLYYRAVHSRADSLCDKRMGWFSIHTYAMPAPIYQRVPVVAHRRYVQLHARQDTIPHHRTGY